MGTKVKADLIQITSDKKLGTTQLRFHETLIYQGFAIDDPR
jgi:hypothetical protein